jgi:hypothetical protein
MRSGISRTSSRLANEYRSRAARDDNGLSSSIQEPIAGHDRKMWGRAGAEVEIEKRRHQSHDITKASPASTSSQAGQAKQACRVHEDRG